MATMAYRAMLQPVFHQKTLRPEQTEQQGRKLIRCDVVFGSPSLGCRGTGVCKITAHQPMRPGGQRQNCRSTVAFLSAGENGQSVCLTLLREFLCTNILRNHLRHNTLEMKEPCSLPPGFVTALGLHVNSIRPGTYRVEEGNGCFKIHFK